MDKEPEITVRRENSGSQDILRSEKNRRTVQITLEKNQHRDGWVQAVTVLVKFLFISTEKMLLF